MFKKILVVLMVYILTIYPQAKSLIPGGESVGVYLQYDGVLVTGTYAFFNESQKIDLNSDTFQNGDLIIQCNEEHINTTSDLTNAIQKAINKQDIQLTILRDKQALHLSIV